MSQVVLKVVVVKLGTVFVDCKSLVYFKVSLDFWTCGIILKSECHFSVQYVVF
jgi:hypothetical protein